MRGVARSSCHFKTEQEESSDEELLLGLAKGSRDSLSILFRRHARAVKSVAFRILRSSAEADDIVQEVLLFVYKKASLFDAAKGSGRSWIIQIAYHRAIDRKRYLVARRFYSTLGFDGVETSLSPSFAGTPYEESIEGVLGIDTLREIQDSLSPDQQRVIELYFYEGHTIDEIAKEMKQTVGNIRNHYYRGLEKIRQSVRAAKLRVK
jgi:RNA polymerase sigma-70 factor (ECF subfamily)